MKLNRSDACVSDDGGIDGDVYKDGHYVTTKFLSKSNKRSETRSSAGRKCLVIGLLPYPKIYDLNQAARS